MACEKQILGSIMGMQELISYLDGSSDTGFPNASEDDKEWQNDDPASWGWGDEEQQPAAGAAPPGPAEVDPEWLDAAHVAVSPLGDMIAVASDQRVVLLSAQWDSESSQWRFVISAKLEVPEASVTALLCLPLASNQRSSSGVADWTCLVMGDCSGALAFYTEDGSLLFRQRLHESAVRSLSCCSRQVTSAAEEEVTAVFQDAVVVLDGFSLYQTLRACRNQLARVRAGGGGGLDVPPLTQQKWELRYQQSLQTAENVGFCSTSLFDHLLAESMHRPGSSVTSASVPAGSLLVTTGRCPFVGFFHAAEGVEQPRLDQVFRGVAAKVKDTVFSTIGSFWTGTSSQKDVANAQQELESGIPINCKFGLPDLQRQGQLIALSRDRRLSAVTDSFGRVTLIDNHRGVALAMWKGYRDAECGWMEVREPRSADGRRSGRRTHFLALYAPRRGLLEVWSTVGGPKVAAFNVTKHGRLLNIAHGLIGLAEASAGRKAAKLLECVFLSPDGRIVTLNVPFHLALGEQGGRRAHGLHLLRELRAQLRAPPPDAASYLRSQLAALRTASARQQALETVLGCRRLTAADMEAAVDAVLDLYSTQEPASLDHECQVLLQTALRYRRLLATFGTLEALAGAPPPYEEDEEVTEQTLSELLRLSRSESAGLLRRLESADAPCSAPAEGRGRVTFAERRSSPAAFLRCFHVGSAGVSVRSGLSDDELRDLADLVFRPCLDRREPPADWRRTVLHCGLPAAELLRLLTACWLDCPSAVQPRHLAGLAALIASVAGTAGGAGVQWSAVQDQLAESCSVRRSLLLATVCRAVACRLEEDKHSALQRRLEKAEEAGEAAAGAAHLSGDWEELTELTVAWELLLHQLRDVDTLCDVLPPAELGGVSLRALLKKGPGAVSELVARWLLADGVRPADLAPQPPPVADATTLEAPPEDAAEEAETAARAAAAAAQREQPREFEWGCDPTDDDSEEARRRRCLHDGLARLGACFPHSVRPDTLLLNCSWEEAAAWNRQREHTDRLARAVTFACRIHNAHLRYGACSLLWTALVCRPCAAVAGLLQRTGRRPDDAPCRREIQLPALSLPDMLTSCHRLLEEMTKALVASEVQQPAVLYNDNLWATHAGPPSLLDLAARQRVCSDDMAALHLQMLDLMCAQVHLGLKNVYPYKCFNETDGRFLFGELTARYTQPQSVDQAVRAKRESLLNRWVSAAVRLATDRPNGQVDISETSTWISRCQQVARGWDIPVDLVRRQYTLDLYNSGHDQVAQEVLLSLSAPDGLASQLLLLAGARVRHYIYTSSQMMELLGRLTMNVADFIKIADVPLQCPSVRLDRTLALLRLVARMQHDTPSERRLALELVYLVESLAGGGGPARR